MSETFEYPDGPVVGAAASPTGFSLSIDRSELKAVATAGHSVQLQKSSDLAQWETINTLQGSGSPFVWSLEDFPETILFFRLQ